MRRAKSDTPISRREFILTATGSAAAVASTSGEATAQETTTQGTTAQGTAAQGTTVEANDDLQFVPQEATVSPGTTVTWRNVGSIPHSVTAYEDEIPEDATYFASGGFDGESAARDAYPEGSIEGGETYEHTFETEGEHGYFCIPHEQAGMVGTVIVSSGGGDAGGGETPAISNDAKLLAIITMTALVSTLFFTYFFIKYGGDYGESEE